MLFAIEVSDSSRTFDLKRKAPIYARAGLRELWVVDVIDRRLIVHREPGIDGYGLIHILRPGDTVAPLAFPDAVCDVIAFTGP